MSEGEYYAEQQTALLQHRPRTAENLPLIPAGPSSDLQPSVVNPAQNDPSSDPVKGFGGLRAGGPQGGGGGSSGGGGGPNFPSFEATPSTTINPTLPLPPSVDGTLGSASTLDTLRPRETTLPHAIAPTYKASVSGPIRHREQPRNNHYQPYPNRQAPTDQSRPGIPSQRMPQYLGSGGSEQQPVRAHVTHVHGRPQGRLENSSR
eukprot:CFRG4092T1